MSISDHEKELARLKDDKDKLEKELRKQMREEIEIRDAQVAKLREVIGEKDSERQTSSRTSGQEVQKWKEQVAQMDKQMSTVQRSHQELVESIKQEAIKKELNFQFQIQDLEHTLKLSGQETTKKDQEVERWQEKVQSQEKTLREQQVKLDHQSKELIFNQSRL